MKHSIKTIKRHNFLLTLATLIATEVTMHSQGIILSEHLGAQDPQSEGFLLNGYGHPILGPVTNDIGMDAWSVAMTSSDAAQYYQNFTPEQTALLAGSWTLSLDLRLLTAPIAPSYDVSTRIITGPQQYSIYFGMEADGDPTVQVWGNSLSPILVVNGAGSTYNDFQLSYDAGAGSASLWINGAEQLSGIVPGAMDATLGSLSWSGYQHAYSVAANWNLVSLETIPEPSTAALFFLGSGILLYARRRFQSKRRFLAAQQQ